jgi:Flp pilus assembly protein TadG
MALSYHAHPTNRKSTRGTRQLGNGQALIEFALVLPLLFLLIVNVENFGGLLFSWITVSNAARSGVQYYITASATIGGPAQPSVSAVQALVMNDMNTLRNSSTAQVCVSTSISATVNCNTAGSAPSSAPPPAETAEGTPPIVFAVGAVDVTYGYQPYIPLWSFPALHIHATLPPLSVHRQAVMRILQ